MENKQLFEIGISNGFALGLACDKNRLQLALVVVIIEVNFKPVRSDIKRLISCFREN